MKLLLTLALAFALTLAVQSQVAEAHANLIRSEPPANSTLDVSPDRITIWFSEPMEAAFSEIQVLNATGARVDNQDSAVDANDLTIMSVNLPELPDGTYTVAWRNLSTIDGHSLRGAFTFSVGVPISETSAAANLRCPTLSIRRRAVHPLDCASQRACAHRRAHIRAAGLRSRAGGSRHPLAARQAAPAPALTLTALNVACPVRVSSGVRSAADNASRHRIRPRTRRSRGTARPGTLAANRMGQDMAVSRRSRRSDRRAVPAAASHPIPPQRKAGSPAFNHTLACPNRIARHPPDKSA